MSKGLFITVEGGEGVGKSTNLANLTALLDQAGVRYISTREPGGTALAEDIRALLLTPRDESMYELTELLLVFAARAQHLETLIKPALAAGTWVVCDRFTDATYAYQGGGRGLSAENIAVLENFVQGELRPDITILLDAPVEVGMARARQRGELDRFELEKLDFFERVRDCYLSLAKANSRRYRLIDASQSLVDVERQMTNLVNALLAEYWSA